VATLLKKYEELFIGFVTLPKPNQCW